VAETDDDQPGDTPAAAFGRYLRSQRELAQLSLRQVAEMARISNPYLSQVERGLHQPSIAVVTALAKALDLSADVLLAQAAGLGATDDDETTDANRTEAAIRADARLSSSEKRALLAVYRSLVAPDT
jgi:transcriptional regulator with XRE-family HTH domain